VRGRRCASPDEQRSSPATVRLAVLVLACAGVASAHDIITTPITWSREISRIVFHKCASCHRPGGTAFSLLTYKEARPWVVAIREETLRRTMPPWGAVKGFGDFRNDEALTPEEIELIVNWSEGGVPEGELKDLPKLPEFPKAPKTNGAGQIAVSGDLKLVRAFKLDGLMPRKVPAGSEFQITAELPDGSVEPLLWLKDYKEAFAHPFLLRKPMVLPAGTLIRGVPKSASVSLLPVR
jgi:mono/diheme cytochrome c family protein